MGTVYSRFVGKRARFDQQRSLENDRAIINHRRLLIYSISAKGVAVLVALSDSSALPNGFAMLRSGRVT